MISKYKILALPFIVLLFAFYAQIKEYPIKVEKTSLNKSLPFPVQPESKTQWTKPNWQKKFYKSLYPVIECNTKIRIYAPDYCTNLVIRKNITFNNNTYSTHTGRSPPLFS